MAVEKKKKLNRPPGVADDASMYDRTLDSEVSARPLKGKTNPTPIRETGERPRDERDLLLQYQPTRTDRHNLAILHEEMGNLKMNPWQELERKGRKGLTNGRDRSNNKKK